LSHPVARKVSSATDGFFAVLSSFFHSVHTRLSDVCSHWSLPSRDVAMLELLRATGIRVSEAVALDRGDVDYEKRRLLIDITKSKEPRSLPISDRAWKAIRVYLRERQDGARVRALREQPLFSRHDRRAGRRPSRLSTRSVQRAIRDYARQAGLDEEELEVIVTPHKFRHRFATDMLRATRGNLGVTQKALGHQSPGVTARYVHLVDEDIDAAFEAMNTEAGSAFHLPRSSQSEKTPKTQTNLSANT
jgi:integrase